MLNVVGKSVLGTIDGDVLIEKVIIRVGAQALHAEKIVEK